VSVDDLAAACAEAMGAGLELLIEPREYAWGRSAYLRDPDGRLVELTQA
jgi:catechol 2,3-dioxygenase-like lactoylglutathione lyase family enzyme